VTNSVVELEAEKQPSSLNSSLNIVNFDNDDSENSKNIFENMTKENDVDQPPPKRFAAEDKAENARYAVKPEKCPKITPILPAGDKVVEVICIDDDDWMTWLVICFQTAFALCICTFYVLTSINEFCE